MPAVSLTLTSSVALAPTLVRLILLTDQPFRPSLVAACQVPPLSVDTYTVSPASRLADSVPLTVCVPTLVMKSLLLLPVSSEKPALMTLVPGGVVSST